MADYVLTPLEDLQGIANTVRVITGENDNFSVSGLCDTMSDLLISNGKKDIFYSILDRSIERFEDNEIKEIGLYGLSHCSNLTTVIVPNIEIFGTYSLTFNRSLRQVYAPQLKEAGTGCFYECSSLEALDFTSLNKIVNQTFKNCTILKSLIIRNTEAVCVLVGINSFEETPIANGTGFIYVPSSLLSAYQTATNWSVYASQFRALEDYTIDGTITGALDPTKIEGEL